ncbi:hypothetical protein L198_06143 [Cryptococcus wingfieldii CBS 7118]|uniref:Uncharacterized protein n=1 Tax=Cryptococcus wingfieldii CBS 7118 TaxID=1295528 RepID=A0A1E3ISD3_9TREE|nr:hypothetical protein L198_06143 [Cryptococcus wingfieldii CBS 7118]ODN90826.1 hypothetical protein L198_06143 [Cryptococcus wingfieldii CBS 7118]
MSSTIQQPSNIIQPPPANACRTQDGNDLLWLGASSSFHPVPMTFHPSPLTLPPIHLLQTTHTLHSPAEKRPILPIPISQDGWWESPTDILFHHHHPSLSYSSCASMQEEDRSLGESMRSYPTKAALQTANKQEGRMEKAKLLRIDVEAGKGEEEVEILPFTPITPENLKRLGDQPTRLADTPQTPQTSRLMIINCHAFPATPTPNPHQPSHPFITTTKEPECTDESPMDLDPSQLQLQTAGSRKFDEMEIDKGTFGQKDSRDELVERTGWVAKRARMGSP